MIATRSECVNSHIALKSPTTRRLPFAHGHDVTSEALGEALGANIDTK